MSECLTITFTLFMSDYVATKNFTIYCFQIQITSLNIQT